MRAVLGKPIIDYGFDQEGHDELADALDDLQAGGEYGGWDMPLKIRQRLHFGWFLDGENFILPQGVCSSTPLLTRKKSISSA